MITIFFMGLIIAILAIIYLPRLQLRQSIGANILNLKETACDDKILTLLNLENELRKTIIQVTGGVFVIAGIFFSWNQFIQTKERDLSEQINKIIVLMGNDEEYVKIGAIYSLKQIATNHENSNLIILDILTSYLRGHAHWNDTLMPDKGSELHRAALEVISNINKHDIESPINLSNTDFRKLDIQLLNFEKGELINSHFEISDLKGANFKDANLVGSSFAAAVLENVSFVGADMHYVSLQDASIKNADFSGADLSGVEGKTRQQIESVAITDKKTIFP